MKTRLISLTALLLTAFSIGFAQTANDTIRRTVLVESVYNPVLASSEKRSFLPDEQPPVTNREAVVYAPVKFPNMSSTVIVEDTVPDPL